MRTMRCMSRCATRVDCCRSETSDWTRVMLAFMSIAVSTTVMIATVIVSVISSSIKVNRLDRSSRLRIAASLSSPRSDRFEDAEGDRLLASHEAQEGGPTGVHPHHDLLDLDLGRRVPPGSASSSSNSRSMLLTADMLNWRTRVVRVKSGSASMP